MAIYKSNPLNVWHLFSTFNLALLIIADKELRSFDILSLILY